MTLIVVKRPDSNEIQELALLTYEVLRASTRFDSKRTLESVIEEVTATCTDENTEIVIAYDDESAVGWTSVYTGFPLMMFIGHWNPVIRVGADPEPIARLLIEQSKKILIPSEHTRLEIELPDITETTEPEMKTYAGWYSQCGFSLAATEVHMRAEVNTAEEFGLPTGYSFEHIRGVSNADLEAPFFDCFDNGQDELYLSLDGPQRAVTFRYFFDRRRPMVDEASLAIFYEGQVVGFVVAREKDGAADIGPVGIVPAHQGKGLSKALMSCSMNELVKNGIRAATLDASASNERARSLYEKYGFRVQHLKAFLVWSK